MVSELKIILKWFLFLLLAISCKTDSSNSDHPFVNFIKDNFNYELSDSTIHFLVISVDGCGGCKEEVVSKWLAQYNEEFELVISARILKQFDKLELNDSTGNIFVDESGKLDRLNFRKGSFNLITIKKGKLINNSIYENPLTYNRILKDYLRNNH